MFQGRGLLNKLDCAEVGASTKQQAFARYQLLPQLFNRPGTDKLGFEL